MEIRRAADHHLIMEVLERAKRDTTQTEADALSEDETQSGRYQDNEPRQMVQPVCS